MTNEILHGIILTERKEGLIRLKNSPIKTISDILATMPGDKRLCICEHSALNLTRHSGTHHLFNAIPWHRFVYSGPADRLPAGFAHLPVAHIEEGGEEAVTAEVKWDCHETSVTVGEAIDGLAPSSTVSIIHTKKVCTWGVDNNGPKMNPWGKKDENVVFSGPIEMMPERFKDLRAIKVHYDYAADFTRVRTTLSIFVLWEPWRGGSHMTVREALPMLGGRTCEILDNNAQSVCYHYGTAQAIKEKTYPEHESDRIQDFVILDWTLNDSITPAVITLYVQQRAEDCVKYISMSDTLTPISVEAGDNILFQGYAGDYEPKTDYPETLVVIGRPYRGDDGKITIPVGMDYI